MTAPRMIRLGGVEIDRAAALQGASHYLGRRRHRFGYPAYDAFDSGSGPFRLGDADFLAPVLLNVKVSVKDFYALSDLRPWLDDWLARVPVDARLAEAGPAELELLGELFGVLDRPAKERARGSILTKVMHRKRPAFVPLYDRHVDYCYRGATAAPLAKDPRRSWGVFLPQLGAALIADLSREAQLLAEVVALAPSPPITSLRALDIVAWQVGRSVGPRPGLWSGDTADDRPSDDGDEALADLTDEV